MRIRWRMFSVWAVVLGCVGFCPTLNLMSDPPNDNNNSKDKNNNGKGNGEEKVTICHKGHTLEVAKPAVQAHLDHGDTLGPCNVTPSQNR